MKKMLLLAVAALVSFARADDFPLKTKDIYVRDPFIVADKKAGLYHMYASMKDIRPEFSGEKVGVQAYSSKDLKNWSRSKPVLILDDTNVYSIWAPEVHEYKGSWYVFATLNHKSPTLKPFVEIKQPKWASFTYRGTAIFKADNPLGPFKPLSDGPIPPHDWMTLDGTLWVENGKPYMVFCHEWVQVIDGTMDVVELSDDLSKAVGKPVKLFAASESPGAIKDPVRSKVTDGPFLLKSKKTGALYMIWSTFLERKPYCLMVSRSDTGSIFGPWKHLPASLDKDGGHGMIFESLDGRLLLSLHQPNHGGKERLHLFSVEDTGETLAIAPIE